MLIYNTYLLTLYKLIIYVYNTIYSIYNSYFNNLISISIIGYHILYFSAGVHVVWSGCLLFSVLIILDVYLWVQIVIVCTAPNICILPLF
jgi:hypothetical protein